MGKIAQLITPTVYMLIVGAQYEKLQGDFVRPYKWPMWYSLGGEKDGGGEGRGERQKKEV